MKGRKRKSGPGDEPTTTALVRVRKPDDEQAALVALIHKQRRERLALAEQHEEKRKAAEAENTKQRKDLEARHVREWFEHRQSWGHTLGPAAQRFMQEGRA